MALQNDFIDMILTRRSVRKFSGKEIEDEKLQAILKCGAFAPTAKNTKAWKFIVTKDKNAFAKIIAANQYASAVKTADVVIAVCIDYDKSLPGYEPIDASAAAENILLAAHALGLGGCWIGTYPNADRVDAMKEIFELPENIDVINLIALGYPDEEPRQPMRDYTHYVMYEKWNEEEAK